MRKDTKIEKVLFICAHNSARSQIAEGILRFYHGDRYEVASAGTYPTKVNPYAVKVMEEIGINISNQYSKSIDEFREESFDYVITVCNKAKEECPFFSKEAKYLNWSFIDPAEATGSEEEIQQVFRKVRDEIKRHIVETFGARRG